MRRVDARFASFACISCVEGESEGYAPISSEEVKDIDMGRYFKGILIEGVDRWY